MLCRWIHVTSVAIALPFVNGSPRDTSTPVQVLETRRGTPPNGDEALQGLRRDLVTAGLKQRDSDTHFFKTNGSLDLMWNDATFFSYDSLSISCVTCYVKGTAYASLAVDGDFNFTQALDEFHDQFWPQVRNISIEVWDQFKNWSHYVTDNVTDTVGDNLVSFFQTGDFDELDIDWGAYSFPTLDVDFEMNLTNIPETTMTLEFDGLELYLELEATLDAEQTYKVNLYPPEWYQPAGIKIGDQLVGVVITLELLLTLSTEVSISAGVHVKFEDGLAIEIAMFGSDVSSIILTDGSFEFLPVTVATSGVVFDATVRMGVTAGLNMSQDLSKDLSKDFIKLAAGSSATVYADLARFITNITTPETLELDARDNSCRMPVVESYELGLGALAGAFVQFRDEKWGPTPETSVRIYYTTMYSACAIDQASATAAVQARRTAAALLAERDGLTATEVTSVVTVTNVVCQSAGLRNCPASLQTTFQVITTSTAIVSVAEGEDAVFPATATTGRIAAIAAFGDTVQKLQASSGSPVSYVPPVETDGSGIGGGVSGVIDDAKDEYNEWSEEHKRLVIGLSAGLGGAFIGVVAAGIWLCSKRRARKQNAMVQSNVEEVHGPDASQPFLGAEPDMKWKQAQAHVCQ